MFADSSELPPDTGFTFKVAGTDLLAVTKAGDSLLSAGLRGGVRIPHLCRVGECGSCRCRLVTGQVKLKRDISQHIDHQALRQGYVLACQSEALSDITVEVPGQSPATAGDGVQTLGGQIKSVSALNHDIRLLVVELENPIHYRSGQYAQLSVPGHADFASAPRCYSFSSAPSAHGQTQVAFHVRQVPGGLFTEWLFAQDRTGEPVELTGPLGNFRVQDDDRPMVCIAGGSGLAPIKAMLEELCERKRASDLTLFLASRSQRDLYCQDELTELQKRWPRPGRLLVVPVLSSEPQATGWKGLTGYCGDHLNSFCNPSESSFYLCGPPVMIDAILGQLQGLIAPEHVHYDRFLDRSTLAPDEAQASTRFLKELTI
ncbi:2Fe-2S iron-sulfur cluster binding domain-containing protein [Pseudomonas koreensis]|uniref:2Fe-2S iron-sulfur cluster binding domain-containing protein n=1 Tax=Pseudomonas koreensis TaxID=198620 RepID=UPI003207A8BB